MDKTKCVVVADPDVNYQKLIIAQLKSEFICIPTGTLTETWEEVKRAYQKNRWPPLLTLELTQPDGDGVDFIRYLQADHYLSWVLVTCITQHRSLEQKIKAFRAGADNYYVKPYLPVNLTGEMLLLLRGGYMARAAQLNR